MRDKISDFNVFQNNLLGRISIIVGAYGGIKTKKVINKNPRFYKSLFSSRFANAKIVPS